MSDENKYGYNEMEFDEYLKKELKKPVHAYYNPSGNSARAVVTRGLLG